MIEQGIEFNYLKVLLEVTKIYTTRTDQQVRQNFRIPEGPYLKR